MKKILFLLFVLGLVPKLTFADSAKAIWCAGNTTLYFTYDDAAYVVGGTYKGQTITTVYDEISEQGYSINSTPWRNNKATKIIIEESFKNFKPTGISYYFNLQSKLTSVEGLKNINFENLTTVRGVFQSCSALTSLDLSTWLPEGNKVSDIWSLFESCSSLTSVNLSNWKTSSVTLMGSMFRNCNKLKTITGDITHWDTSNVTSISSMFYQCQALTSLDLSGWNTANVTSLHSTFYYCTNLKTLNISGWDTANVTDCKETFDHCLVLTVLDVSGWNTAKVTSLHNTFSWCKAVEKLDVSGWKTENVTNLQYTFQGCEAVTKLDVSNWNTAKVTNMQYTFDQCKNVKTLDVSGWDTKNVTTLKCTFESCNLVETLDVSKWNTDKVTNMYGTFAGCQSLKTLDVSNWNTANVTNLSYTFSSCKSLTSLDAVKGWNTAKVTDLSYTFQYCDNLTSLDLNKWDTSKVTNLEGAFQYCPKLTSLNIKDWDTSKVTNFNTLFRNDTFDEIDVSKWNTSSATKMESTFAGFTAPSLDITKWDFSKVQSLRGFLSNCGLKSITFGDKFCLAECTDYANMISGEKLRYVDFYNAVETYPEGKNWSITSTIAQSMFNRLANYVVVYIPKGSQSVTDRANTVYSYDAEGTDLRCPNYYSTDEVTLSDETKYKVDIELPRAFKTNKAEYTRTMSTQYGSVILPYDFTTNDNIQAYTLDEEHTETMYFKDTETVPAHTPFAFKKLGEADFTMTDDSNNFGIEVKATHTTSAAEGGEPYTADTNLDGWKAKGYYVNETVANDGSTFYIASDKFYKADDDLTLYPHRVTFHGTWANGAPGVKAINTVNDEETAIDAAEARMAEQNTIYDAQGRQRSKLGQGLNIILMNDGSARKVIRK